MATEVGKDSSGVSTSWAALCQSSLAWQLFAGISMFSSSICKSRRKQPPGGNRSIRSSVGTPSNRFRSIGLAVTRLRHRDASAANDAHSEQRKRRRMTEHLLQQARRKRIPLVLSDILDVRGNQECRFGNRGCSHGTFPSPVPRKTTNHSPPGCGLLAQIY